MPEYKSLMVNPDDFERFIGLLKPGENRVKGFGRLINLAAHEANSSPQQAES